MTITKSDKGAAFAMLYDEGMQTVSCGTDWSLSCLPLTPVGQRRKVLGDKYVDAALAKGSSEFGRAGQEYVTRNAWDGIWGRPGLEPKLRSLVVIS